MKQGKVNRQIKVIGMALILVLSTALLFGCGSKENEAVSKTGAEAEIETTTEEVTTKDTATEDEYESLGINEMGQIPVMMYHGIENVSSESTGYTGGNVDADGYNRTAEAFAADLEKYYDLGYRMIRLTDYVDGYIDVEKGKSPIVITFDDGRDDQCLVTGLDENGDIIIDPNSGVGILEAFKEKHPDAPVTATFFVNGTLFQQPEYNEQILNWLVGHGYDVGNHTWTHVNLSKCSTDEVPKEVGAVYEELDQIIPGKYVNIIALPFGSGAEADSVTRPLIYSTEYNGRTYETKAALMVGWKSEWAPFDSDFDPLLIKRCRAYDNNGQEYDISYMFDSYLPEYRFVSDGDPDTIVVKEKDLDWVTHDFGHKVISYSDSGTSSGTEETDAALYSKEYFLQRARLRFDIKKFCVILTKNINNYIILSEL